nr:MAG TPA: hypothetical protein [Caudoviricetes sp.]
MTIPATPRNPRTRKNPPRRRLTRKRKRPKST